MNVAELTCKEVNRALAERRGWTFAPNVRIVALGYPPKELDIFGTLCPIPDYCHDWRWAGVLQDEIIGKVDASFEKKWRSFRGELIGIRDGYYDPTDWTCPPGHDDRFMPLKEAISRARLQMYLDQEKEK